MINNGLHGATAINNDPGVPLMSPSPPALLLFTSQSVIKSVNRRGHLKRGAGEVFPRHFICLVPSKSLAATFVPLVTAVFFPCTALRLLPRSSLKKNSTEQRRPPSRRTGREQTTSARAFPNNTDPLTQTGGLLKVV